MWVVREREPQRPVIFVSIRNSTLFTQVILKLRSGFLRNGKSIQPFEKFFSKKYTYLISEVFPHRCCFNCLRFLVFQPINTRIKWRQEVLSELSFRFPFGCEQSLSSARSWGETEPKKIRSRGLGSSTQKEITFITATLSLFFFKEKTLF